MKFLDPKIYYEALRGRDKRFDGLFYVAVKSTGVYCRPVCKAQTPLFKNCQFHLSAASAEKAGYRPCLRCRPELAPGNAAVDASGRIAALAMSRIEDGALSMGGVDELAQEMGISSRHLRRIIEAEYGVAPIELAQTKKLLTAKLLLTDTNLPLATVALASGFSSIRRFNTLFLERYRMNPTQIRKSGAAKTADDSFVCALAYREPYDWQSILSFLKARACRGVEFVDETKYMRTVSSGAHTGWLSVERNNAKDAVLVTVSNSLAPMLYQIIARVKRLFDLHCAPEIIDKHLGKLAISHPGLRVPGAFDGTEVAVRAILGQQVSVKGASVLAGRLVKLLGKSIVTPFPELNLLTPTSAELARAEAADIAALGIIGARAKTIVALAKAIDRGDLLLEAGAEVTRSTISLKAIHGIGEWTADYIAMRCLAWPDAFPVSDLGIKKALKLESKRSIVEAAEKWRPWRSYAAMHLWKSLE